jgi:hypothetical protein
MKYLNDYTEDPITEILHEYGAFFAFNEKQFNEQKKENTKYISMGMGLLCPKGKHLQLIDDINAIGKKGIKEDIQENGIENIIYRELCNHEAFYTGSLGDTFEALQGYGITLKQVSKVFNDHKDELE